MFGQFKLPTYTDPELGQFIRSRGMWRGTVQLPGLSAVPLALSGTKSEPDSQALAAARTLATLVPGWAPAIESELFEHYRPYTEAIDAGELPQPDTNPFPVFTKQAEVLAACTPLFVAVSPLDGTMTVELGCTVAWDEEHTLGARFQEGHFVELNGSVLPP